MASKGTASMDDVWFKKGLRFTCTQCGGCCTGAPGYVWLEEEDIERLSTFLNLSKEAFLRRYTRQVGGRISLIEDRHNFDCVFLKEKKCTVHPARPKQCKTFPWWSDHLTSKEHWEEAKERCEGIDHPEGKLFSAEEILEELNS